MVDWNHLLHDVLNKPRQIYRRRQTNRITFTHYGITDSKNPAFIAAVLHRDLNALCQELDEAVNKSLEVGCGFGRLTPWIADRSGEHHAIEPNPNTLKSAREQYRHVTFRQADAQDIPYPEDTFDMVHTFAVLMHIPPAELEAAVAEMKRVLRPDGVVILGEQTSPEGSETVFPRTRSEYETLFKPWSLQSYTVREGAHNERFAEELSVMRFEGKEGG